MNHKFLYWNLEATTLDENQKSKYELMASQAYQKIKELTDFYNTKLSDGKWNHMMSMNPRNLPVFDSVKKNTFSNEMAIKTTNRIDIQANKFSGKEDAKEYKWKPINGLGYSNNAITLFPFDQHIFKNEKPAVSYEFEIEQQDNYTIEVRLLPTHANNFDHEIGIQLDGNAAQFFKTNTKDRENTWKENVLRNSAIVKLPVSNVSKGKHTITIQVNQTGIVLDQLAVYKTGL